MEQHAHTCELCRIELEHVTVTLDGQALVEDVNLHVHCGELTVLIGANGAGKTTLLRALLGELPYQGTVRHVRLDGSALRSVRIGYVPQSMAFDRAAPVTVLDFFAAATARRPVWRGVGKRDRAAALAALRATRCEALIDRRLGALSGGELQRVLLALALTPNPDLLILDEPVSGVDRNGLEQFYRMVSGLRGSCHLAILLVSHDFDVARRYADRVVLMRRGVLSEGAPAEVFASQAFAREFGLGSPPEPERTGGGT
jgi:zinc transport system ATP-binding protein